MARTVGIVPGRTTRVKTWNLFVLLTWVVPLRLPGTETKNRCSRKTLLILVTCGTTTLRQSPMRFTELRSPQIGTSSVTVGTTTAVTSMVSRTLWFPKLMWDRLQVVSELKNMETTAIVLVNMTAPSSLCLTGRCRNRSAQPLSAYVSGTTPGG